MSRMSASFREHARALLVWQLETLVLLVTCLAMVLAATDAVRHGSRLIIGLLMVNGVIALLAVTYASVVDGVSLRLIFWFYNLFFLAVTPLAQYVTGINWIFVVDDASLMRAALYVLLYQLTFLLAYPYGIRAAARVADGGHRRYRISGRRLAAVAGFAAGFAAIVAMLSDYRGIGSLLGQAFGYEGMRGHFGGFLVRPAVFFLAPLAFLWWRTQPPGVERAFVAGCAMTAAALFNSPLSGTRFYVFATAFGLLVFLAPPGRRNRPLFLLALVVSLFGAFFLNVALSRIILHRPAPVSLAAYFYQGHFDGFENLAHGIDFVATHGIVWGRQLVGALLFFVPRAVWPTKPIGTAAFVNSQLSDANVAAYSNMAPPFVEESVVNFGAVGVVLFSGALAVAFGYLDAAYRRRAVAAGSPLRCCRPVVTRPELRSLVLYPVLLGLALFFLRGDMLSGMAYSSGIIVSYELVTRVLLIPAEEAPRA